MDTLGRYIDGQKGIVDEQPLNFYFWDGVQWVEEATNTKGDANQVTATSNHLLSWIAMGDI